MSWRRRRRRENDRVVSRSGATEFDVATGTVPRSTYRDFEAHGGYAPDEAVYLERVQRGTGWPHRWPKPTVFVHRPLYKHAAKQRSTHIPRILSWRLPLRERPGVVGFCVRRKVRKQVMFALNVAGKRGVGRGKSWHRNRNSSYRCSNVG